MIDFYTWSTPNGRKISIMLEELGAPYTTHGVDIGKDEQFDPAFLEISPNNKIPAIVDHHNGLKLMESGAILTYLAEKHGQFLPTDPIKRARVNEWLMWQVGGFGPMLGQTHVYHRYNQGKSAFAEERFLKETARLYTVLNKRLEGRDYIADEYSIADIACWPWASRYEWHGISLSDYPNVRAWYQRIATRPAVQAGYHTPKKIGEIPTG